MTILSASSKPLIRGPTSSSTDSETESDSEIDVPPSPVVILPTCKPLRLRSYTYLRCKRLRPRPGFPLAPGQRHLGPLVLDREKKILVPAAINTYLRDYQRDGVRFLWRQYEEGRGGLLGDDMGLVCGLNFSGSLVSCSTV